MLSARDWELRRREKRVSYRGFKLTPQIQDHISELLEKNRAGQLTVAEEAELDGYAEVNSFMRQFKIRALQDLKATS